MLWWTLRRLSSRNAAVKRAAVARLSRSRDSRAVSALVAALEDRDVRKEAAQGLGTIGGPAAVAALATALIGSQIRGAVSFADDVADVLAGMGDPRVVDRVFSCFQGQAHKRRDILPTLRPCLVRLVRPLGPEGLSRLIAQVERGATRAGVAVGVLELIAGPAATKALVAALDTEAREAAAYALGRLRAPEAVAPLIEFIDGEQPSAALELLVQIGGGRAYGAVEAALMHRRLSVRSSAASILTASGYDPADDDQRLTLALAREPAEWPTATALGPNTIGRLRGLLKDESASVRAHAGRLLGDLRSTEAVEDLLALLDDPEYSVRAAAAKAFGAIRNRRAVEDPLALLGHPEHSGRAAAAEAPGTALEGRGVEALIRVLQSPTHHLAAEGAIAELGRLADARAVGPIVDFLVDDSVDWEFRALVARVAVEALESTVGARAREIPDADLDAMASLGDTVTVGEMHWQGDMPYVKTEMLDISALRQSAVRELERRGRPVPTPTLRTMLGLRDERPDRYDYGLRRDAMVLLDDPCTIDSLVMLYERDAPHGTLRHRALARLDRMLSHDVLTRLGNEDVDRLSRLPMLPSHEPRLPYADGDWVPDVNSGKVWKAIREKVAQERRRRGKQSQAPGPDAC